MPPRSSATTFKPASVNSLPRMPPVQPRPTMTTSTSFILVAMSSSVSAHVRDADRIGGVFLIAKLLDVLIMESDNAGEADHLPTHLILVAAVDGVGEHPFHYGLIHRSEKNARRRPIFKCNLASLKPKQKFLALARGNLVERFAVRLDA